VRLGKNAKIDLLKRVPLFAGCSKAELHEIALSADELDLRDGHVLTREGRPGREFFVLIEGTVSVTKDGKSLPTSATETGSARSLSSRMSPVQQP